MRERLRRSDIEGKQTMKTGETSHSTSARAVALHRAAHLARTFHRLKVNFLQTVLKPMLILSRWA